jgi:hypothetical protein
MQYRPNSYFISEKYSTGHLLTQNADDGSYKTLTHYKYDCPDLSQNLILDAFEKVRNPTSSCLVVRLSVGMGHFGSHWTDVCEI